MSHSGRFNIAPPIAEIVKSTFDTSTQVAGIGGGGGGTSRFPLSMSPFGRPLGVTDTAATIHMPTVTQGDAMEDLYLWASNYSNSDVVLTMSVGSSDLSDQPIKVTISAGAGFVLVYPGIPITTFGVYAKASANSALNLTGFVMRHNAIAPGSPASGYNGSML